MEAPGHRRVGGLIVFALGLVMLLAGVYHLYCRFVSDEAWWDRSAATGRRLAALETKSTAAHGDVEQFAALMARDREQADTLRQTDQEEEARRTEEGLETAEARLQQMRERLIENDEQVAGMRAAIGERRGQWLRRGLLLLAVGLALSVRGWVQADLGSGSHPPR